MRIRPQAPGALPQEWADFAGIIPIDLTQLDAMIPGAGTAAEITLRVPIAPLLGHMQFSELAIVVAAVRAMGAESFAEIGTFDGLTVLNLLENCPAVRSVTTVDLPEDTQSAKGAGSVYPIDAVNASMIDTVRIGERFEAHARRGIVKQIRRDSALLEPGDFGSGVDVFFVDGSHTYDYCKSDSRLAEAVTRDLIIWHDYGNVKYLPGVTQTLFEIAREGGMKLYWLDSAPLRTSLVFGIPG